MNTFLKDFFRVGISKILMIIFGLSSSIITARYIGPSGNGIIAALTVYPSLFMSFGSLGISQSTTYYTGKGVFTEIQIKRAITQIWLMTSLVSVIVCFLLMRFLSDSGSNLLLVGLALLPIPFSLFNTYNSGIFLGKNDIGTYNKINWIPVFLILLGGILFVIVLKLDIAGAMMATILGSLFMSIMLLFKNKFLQAFSISYDWKIIKAMLSLGVIYALSLLIINLNYKVDVILMDKLSTSYELGLYSKGAAITEYLWQIPMLFSTIVFARSAAAKDPKEFSKKVAQLLRLSFILIGVTSLILWAFSKYIIIGMYGKAFFGSISVLNYLLPGVLILTIFKVMNMDLAGRGKPWIAMKAMVPALIINVVLNLILIPKYGANGSAISSTVSYTASGILFLFLYSRETQMPIKDIVAFRKSDFNPIKNIASKVLKRS